MHQDVEATTSRWSQAGLISRTSILILACVLFSMGLGKQIPDDLAERCILFGALGLVSYVACALAASYWFRRSRDAFLKRSKRIIENRLTQLGLADR